MRLKEREKERPRGKSCDGKREDPIESHCGIAKKKKGLDWLMMGKKDAREEQKLLRCEDRHKKSSSDFKNSYPILINCVR